MLKLIHNGIECSYEKGTPISKIAEDFQKDYSQKIVLGKLNGKLIELFKPLTAGGEISFRTLSDSEGHKTYKRSACFLLAKAFDDIVGSKNGEHIVVEFSLGAGYYCEIRGIKVTKKLVGQLKERMKELVKADIALVKKKYPKDMAVKLFSERNMTDKAELFKYRISSNVNIYFLEDFADYFYGFMVPSTGYINNFDLFLYEDGVILQLPERKNPECVPEFTDLKNLFFCINTTNNWASKLEIENVGQLNKIICDGKVNDLIMLQEALQESSMAEIATLIQKSGSRFVMIAGPSSSGKTSFSHRLSVHLMARGLKPHPIALDDYFIDRDLTPLDENGQKDFECLEALNIDRINSDMTGLLRGEEVMLPKYNFITGKSEDGRLMKMNESDILVMEGIHGLNDALTHSLPRESKYKIYLSALTVLNIDDHNRIPTTDVRLLRRMVRDYRTRGASASRTLNMWDSVRRGENRNIFPFQETADSMFNSSLIYELACLKIFAEPLLFGIEESDPSYLEAVRLLKFLQYFLGVNTEMLPKNSLIREFVGGSIFNV
ncbi:MAG: nucleoside kinase [Lachnospiraceae bacterium]|nr:nucleoside kinase [Lachnospiraceae bacterium]